MPTCFTRDYYSPRHKCIDHQHSLLDRLKVSIPTLGSLARNNFVVTCSSRKQSCRSPQPRRIIIYWLKKCLTALFIVQSFLVVIPPLFYHQMACSQMTTPASTFDSPAQPPASLLASGFKRATFHVIQLENLEDRIQQPWLLLLFHHLPHLSSTRLNFAPS